MKTFTTWLLGGALAASLTWNFDLYRRSTATAGGNGASGGAASAMSCDGTSCSLAGGDLGLDPELQAQLSQLCATSCGESDRLERQANELQAQLLEGLSAATVDEAATAKLVDQVSELRRRSLASCVAGILGVRKVLAPEQVRALLARCEHGAASQR